MSSTWRSNGAFPGVGVERRHARDEHHVAGPGAGRHRRAPLLEIAVDGFDPDDFPFHAFAPGPFGVSLRPQPMAHTVRCLAACLRVREAPGDLANQLASVHVWNNRCRLAGGHSLLQPLSEKYCYGQQFPRMRPCERSGNRNGRRHQLVEPPQTTPPLVVRDRSGWRCWLGVGEAPRRGPSTSGLYRFHPRPSAYRDRSRLGHQLGVRSSCRSSAARVTQVARTPRAA
jgi:hypothetical protein